MTDFHKDVKEKPGDNKPHGDEGKPDNKPDGGQPPTMIELFVQAEGVADMQLLKVPDDARVSDVIVALRGKGLTVVEDLVVMLEDEESELPHSARLRDLKIGHRRRLHCHRCRRIQVSVSYNGVETGSFPPSATIGRVKKWADKEFGLKGQDATDLALQISGTTNKPEEDVHIGTLVRHPNCELRLELVPKKFVQG